MPDDEVVETPVETPVAETPPVEPITEVEPHPLEPGGKRFQEVYGDWRREQQARERAEQEAAALRAQVASQQRPQGPVGPVIYTPQQLQQAVDQGLVTPMVAADILSRQNSEAAATRTALQVEQARTLAQKQQAAGTEVNQYIDRIPALLDRGSQEFRKVEQAANSISDEMGLPVTDLRVQRRALREVYGTLDRITQANTDRESSRRASLPHVESTPGGTRNPGTQKVDDAWKKDVPGRYFEFWKKQGYSEARMKDEAKYITNTH